MYLSISKSITNTIVLVTTMMAITSVITTTVQAAPTPQESTTPTTFPADIQEGIQRLQGYIQNVMKDFAQASSPPSTTNLTQQQITTDYSSTGRSLDFWLRNTFLPNGPNDCPQAQAGEPLPPQAKTYDEANQYLQQTQLALIAVSQDAINDEFEQGVFDACESVRFYGGGAMSF